MTAVPSDRVAAVITHYKSPAALRQCLVALAAEGSLAAGAVVVADSDAQPGHGGILPRTLPGARYLAFPKNVGYAALVNGGIRATASEYVLVLNADVVVRPGLVADLVAHLDRHPEVAVVAPALVNEDGTEQLSAFSFYRPETVVYRRTSIGRLPHARRELERFFAVDEKALAVQQGSHADVDWVMGAAMLVRRAAIDDVGPLDEGYWMYFEDVDLCWRFWSRGWSVHYLPGVAALHAHGRASKRHGALDVLLNPMTRHHITAARRFFRKHGTDHRRPVPVTGLGGAEAA